MTTLPQLSVKAPFAATRAEVELLLCCARLQIDLETAERIKTLIQQGIDWAYLTQTAAQHGIMPLLYRSLSTTCPEAVPQAILSQMRNQFHSNTLHNLFLTKGLLDLLELFKAHDIAVIPFKGPVLAASAYGNLSFRQFCDLDILVHERDFLKAQDLLVSQGYQPIPDLQLSWEAHFVHADRGVNVDLHQRIMPQHFPSLLDFEHLWQRLEPVSLAGTTVVNLSPEDTLILLSVQVAKDCGKKREWLAKVCDIAQLIHAYEALDWQRVMQRASMLNSERSLFLGLLLASDLLGTALPEEVLQRMQVDPAVKLYAVQVRKQLFCETDSSHGVFESFLKRFMMERPLGKVPHSGHLIWHFLRLGITPNERDRNFLPLPASLSFLYCLVRPIRLAGRYALIILKHLKLAKPHTI